MIDDAFRIATATGAKLLAAQFNARVERGRGRHPLARLVYAYDQSVATLAGTKHLVLIGTAPPVAPFAYPNKPGYLFPKDCGVHVLARPDQDIADALVRLADELAAPPVALPQTQRVEADLRATISPESITQVLAALLPENAVVVDESVSFGRSLLQRPGVRAAARLAANHRRLHRQRLADGDRRRHCRARPPRRRAPG